MDQITINTYTHNLLYFVLLAYAMLIGEQNMNKNE